jgi:P27 family predicted phage terminase small subunit
MSSGRNGRGSLAVVAGSRVVPKAPEGLEAVGAAIWALAWGQPQIHKADVVAVTRLCHLEDEAARLRAVLAADGEILRKPLQNSKGERLGEQTYVHPAVTALRKLDEQLTPLIGTLGLSPAARERLGLVVAEREEDEIDALKRRHAALRAADGLGD